MRVPCTSSHSLAQDWKDFLGFRTWSPFKGEISLGTENASVGHSDSMVMFKIV